MLSLGMPMAPSVVLQMVGPRVANHVLETMHAAYPGPLPALARARSDRRRRGARRRRAMRAATVERDPQAVLEAAADEIRHLLDEGVVGVAADVDACLILGAGYPFFLGGHHEAPRSRISTSGDRRVRQDSGDSRRFPHPDRRRGEGAGGLLDRLAARRSSGEAAELARDLEARRLVGLAGRRRRLRLRVDPRRGRAGARGDPGRDPRQRDRARSRARSSTGSTPRTAGTTSRRRETWEEEAARARLCPLGGARRRSPRTTRRATLADRLEQEGYAVERRWQYLIVGAATRSEDAEALAARDPRRGRAGRRDRLGDRSREPVRRLRRPGRHRNPRSDS